jgi:predicted metal-dependent phosphoesterase TrpH
MIVDMHVHTARGGYDSSLTVPELVEEAMMKGIGGVCLTEHMHFWSKSELDGFGSDHNVLLIAGIEVETDMGHILAFGLDRYVSGMHRARELRRVADEVGGVLVVAHPFRMFFHLEDFNAKPKREWPEAFADALELPALDVVDAVEVLNGGCTERENRLAVEVARERGLKATGGSDAHSSRGIGSFVTVFEKEIESRGDLIAELKAGRFRPAKRLRDGGVVPFDDEACSGPL